MRTLIDLTGVRYGRLMVIERAGSDKYHNSLWFCKCDCGKNTTVPTGSLKRGLTKSCGCYGVEMLKSGRNITHGLYGKKGSANRRIHGIWQGILRRCLNSKNRRFYRYGGRGIEVCEDWKNSFESFHSWAISNGYADGLTIDRIDNDGHYSPENCQWVTRSENSWKKSTTILISVNGEVKSATKWAKLIKKDVHFVLAYYKEKGLSETEKFIKSCI